MCVDRTDTNEVRITHKFLSMMLGVRRAGVTEAIHLLEGRELIRATRGKITIRNRADLQRMAGRTYGLAEDEYRRLFDRA